MSRSMCVPPTPFRSARTPPQRRPCTRARLSRPRTSCLFLPWFVVPTRSIGDVGPLRGASHETTPAVGAHGHEQPCNLYCPRADRHELGLEQLHYPVECCSGQVLRLRRLEQ